jgi:putative heme iron utilization protein
LGQYVVQGLPGARRFERIEEAQAYARDKLAQAVRHAARAAGSAETRVDIESRDRIGAAVDGTEIFLERILTARLVGRPDVSLGAPAGD